MYKYIQFIHVYIERKHEKKICDIIKRMFCAVYMLFLIFILFAMDRSSVICLSLILTHSFYHISQLFCDVLYLTSGIVIDCRAMDKQRTRSHYFNV